MHMYAKIIVKNCEGTEILFYLQVNKLASCRFMDADIKHDAHESEIKNGWLTPEKALAHVGQFPEPQLPQIDMKSAR